MRKLLPDSVAQERGTVVHKVLELCNARSLTVEERRDLLDEIIDRRDYPSRNPNSVMVGERFEDFFGLSDWNNRVTWIPVIDANEAIPPKQLVSASDGRQFRQPGDTDLADQKPVPGSEVWIASNRLKLRGKIDQVVANSAGSWKLIEYKTHNVLNADGSMRESTKAQLLLYALMVHELCPTDVIELVAYGRESRPVAFEFDENAKKEAVDLYEGQIALFPDNSTLDIQADAKPSSACRFCPYRPGCPAYHDWAQECWSGNEVANGCPKDTWGIVTEVTPEEDYPNGFVYLEDGAGREVQLKFLHPEVVREPLTAGTKIWCYSMKTDMKSEGHPRSFFHHRPDPRKAHESAVASRIYFVA